MTDLKVEKVRKLINNGFIGVKQKLEEIDQAMKKVKGIQGEIEEMEKKMNEKESEEEDVIKEVVLNEDEEVEGEAFSSAEVVYNSKLAEISRNISFGESSAFEEETPFYKSEPKTETHGVKLIKGHLHFTNQAVPYYDPGQPHSINYKQRGASWEDYLIAGGFFLTCLIIVAFTFWVFKKLCVWLFFGHRYTQFDNEKNDSISSVNTYYADRQREEFRK